MQEFSVRPPAWFPGSVPLTMDYIVMPDAAIKVSVVIEPAHRAGGKSNRIPALVGHLQTLKCQVHLGIRRSCAASIARVGITHGTCNLRIQDQKSVCPNHFS